MIVGTKGLSGDLFKWILVGVAGAFILAFFFRFAAQHIGLSETITERQLVYHMRDQLDALSVSESSSTALALRTKQELLFSCGAIGSGTFVHDAGQIIYGPPRFEGDKLLLWTETWHFPFAVAPFFYVSHPRHRVIVVYDDRSADAVKKLSFPSPFRVHTVHRSQLDLAALRQQNAGMEEIHLVYLTPAPDVNAITQAFRGMALSVTEVDAATHRVRLLNRQETSFYFGESMLTGLFFAPEQYACLQRKALERLHRVAAVLEQRAHLLRGKTDSSACQDYLFQAAQLFGILRTSEDGDALLDAATRLGHQQDLLEQHGCPGAY